MNEDRATVLLKAVLEILNKCDEGPYQNFSVEVINYTPVNIEEVRTK